MDYTIRLSFAMFGDVIPLEKVAGVMALRKTLGGGALPWHQGTYRAMKIQYERLVLDAVAKGALSVCDQFGNVGGGEIDCSDIHGLYVKAHHLNQWAATNGDSFTMVDTGVEVTETALGIFTIEAAPAQPPSAPAPEVADQTDAVGAGGDGLTPLETGEGLTTKAIAAIFDGVNDWPENRWPKNLSGSKWLHPARTGLGAAGGGSATWNPLALAQILLERTKSKRSLEQMVKALKNRFNQNPVLMPWRDSFNEHCATFIESD